MKDFQLRFFFFEFGFFGAGWPLAGRPFGSVAGAGPFGSVKSLGSYHLGQAEGHLAR